MSPLGWHGFPNAGRKAVVGIVFSSRAKRVLKYPSNTLIFAHSFINFCSDYPNLSSSFVEFANGNPAFSLKNKDLNFSRLPLRRT
jgi:hypothetical protein